MFFFFIFKKKSREIVLAYYFKITVKPFFIGLALDVKIIFKKHKLSPRMSFIGLDKC